LKIKSEERINPDNEKELHFNEAKGERETKIVREREVLYKH